MHCRATKGNVAGEFCYGYAQLPLRLRRSTRGGGHPACRLPGMHL